MDWTDLQIFLAVARTKSMTQAAKEMHLAQSAISNRIQRLEKELHIKLFTRSSLGVALTNPGNAFYRYAEQSLATLYKGIDSIQQRGKPEQALKMGVTSPLAPSIAPSLIRCYRLHRPAYFFEISTMDSDSVLDNIRHGVSHAGLFSAADRSLEGICAEEVMQQTFYLMGPQDIISTHMKGTDHVSLRSAFPHLPYVLPKQNYSLRRLIDDFFRREEIDSPHIVAESDNNIVINQLVNQGLGCTILTNVNEIEDTEIVSAEIPLTKIPINDFFPPRPVYFGYAANLSEPLKTFMEHMIQYLRFQFSSMQDEILDQTNASK